jgi:hypothetical protein
MLGLLMNELERLGEEVFLYLLRKTEEGNGGYQRK